MTAANFSELERLCALHSEATCDHANCEKFYKGMAQYLDALEDLGEYRFADIAMEALVNCVPNPSGGCKTSDTVQSVMRKLHALASRAVRTAWLSADQESEDRSEDCAPAPRPPRSARVVGAGFVPG